MPAARKFSRVITHFWQRPQLREGSSPSQQVLIPSIASGNGRRASTLSVRPNAPPSVTTRKQSLDTSVSRMAGWEKPKRGEPCGVPPETRPTPKRPENNDSAAAVSGMAESGQTLWPPYGQPPATPWRWKPAGRERQRQERAPRASAAGVQGPGNTTAVGDCRSERRMADEGAGHHRRRCRPAVGPYGERIAAKQVWQGRAGPRKALLGDEVPTAGVDPDGAVGTDGVKRRGDDGEHADLRIDHASSAGVGAHHDRLDALGSKRRERVFLAVPPHRVRRLPLQSHDAHGGADAERPRHESVEVADEGVRRSQPPPTKRTARRRCPVGAGRRSPGVKHRPRCLPPHHAPV